MRATWRDVRKEPDLLGVWWTDLPLRRAATWQRLFFEQGQGWFRWGFDDRTWYEYIPGVGNAPEFYRVCPPLRRAWLWLRAWLWHPYGVARGYLAWGETPSWADVADLRDEDRHFIGSKAQ